MVPVKGQAASSGGRLAFPRASAAGGASAGPSGQKELLSRTVTPTPIRQTRKHISNDQRFHPCRFVWFDRITRSRSPSNGGDHPPVAASRHWRGLLALWNGLHR